MIAIVIAIVSAIVIAIGDICSALCAKVPSSEKKTISDTGINNRCV